MNKKIIILTLLILVFAVGVNTVKASTSTDENLTLNGTFRYSTTPTAGYVLTSTDGLGNASWTAAATGTVTSVSGGTTGLTFSNPTTTPTMSGTLVVANGGLGANMTAGAIGAIPYATATTTYGTLADVAAGSYLRSGGVGAAPLWSTLVLPNAAATGDILSATSANTVGNLADVAVGRVLTSGGVGVAPAYSATPTLGVNTTTTGQLILANGGASGTSVTIQNNGATAAYNFNLPTTAGTSGQVLTSAGGVAAPMTWTTPSTNYWQRNSATLSPATNGDAIAGSTAANGTLTLEGNNTTGNTLTNSNLIFKVGDSAGTTAMTILNNGKIGMGVTSPAANLQITTTGAGTISFGDVSAFPNKTASTDGGIGLYNLPGSVTPAFKMGLFTEVTGQLLSYGINVSQIGDRDTTKTGAIFRMDTRATSPYFSVKRQAIGGSTEFSDIQIAQAGDIGMGGWASDTNAFPGNVSILARSAATIGEVVRGAAAQTGDLTEWQDNTGTVLSKVNSAGALTIGQSGTAITRHLSATASLDFPSTSNTCNNLTVAVANSAVGDTVVATPTAVAGGTETLLLNWNAWVSVAGTVTIRVCNGTGAAQNPAVQTWRVDVWQH